MLIGVLAARWLHQRLGQPAWSAGAHKFLGNGIATDCAAAHTGIASASTHNGDGS